MELFFPCVLVYFAIIASRRSDKGGFCTHQTLSANANYCIVIGKCSFSNYTNIMRSTSIFLVQRLQIAHVQQELYIDVVGLLYTCILHLCNLSIEHEVLLWYVTSINSLNSCFELRISILIHSQFDHWSIIYRSAMVL